MKILVADLDGTLLGGDAADRRRLHAVLARHPEVTVVFATGRGLALGTSGARDPLLPTAALDHHRRRGRRDRRTGPEPRSRTLQARLRAGWPGAERVRVALPRFPALTYQHGVAQDGRCSFYLAPERLTQEITRAVRALGCTWAVLGDRYFDVLPPGVSKGSALVALAREQHWPMASVLVAGDSLNDLSLFRLGAHGVIVGNAEPALRAAIAADDTVHRADRSGAAGVLSALQDLGWVERDYPLVVGYHRPPVSWTPDGWRPPSSPNGVLPTLRSLFTGNLTSHLGSRRGPRTGLHPRPAWTGTTPGCRCRSCR